MTPDEAVREMVEVARKEAFQFGNLVYSDGRWVLCNSTDTPVPICHESVRCYLVGLLQEWYAKISKEADDDGGDLPAPKQLCEDIRYSTCNDKFLPALWECYKIVKKIEVV